MGAFFKRAIRSCGLLFAFLFIASCGGKSSSSPYSIALDPAWYSLELPGREASITGFSIELIEAIGKAENVPIAVDQRSWSNLIYGLQQGDYDAICSTMQPYLFYEKLYDFSDLYLNTGTVLVIASKSDFKALDQMPGKVVGILRGSKDALILEKYPDIIQITYDSVNDLLSAVADQTIDGALLDVLTADAFTRDLYQDKLKVATTPLTQDGVRVIALREHSSKLIQIFNRGLARLQVNGKYQEIAKKWNLSE